MPEPSPITDEQLLTRFNRGDRSALGLLAARYENSLVGLATGLLNGRADLAHDAVQESWVRVIKYAKSFAGQSSFKTWMFRIVINNCRSMREAARTTPSPSLLGEGGGGSATPGAGASRSTPKTPDSPLRLVAPEVDVEEVIAALASLPAQTRLLLLLCYHRGLTHPQAADVLGIPVGTLKSRLHAALTELRADLQRNHQTPATRKAATQ